MRHDTFAFLLALVLAGAVTAAQDTKTTTNTKVKSDNGQVVTVTGCVMIGGGTNFLLTNITSERVTPDKQGKTTSSDEPVYALVERDGLDLGSSIDHQVELTGVVVPAATKSDRDDKIEIKETTKVDVANGPDKKSSTAKTVKVARGATNQFLVASVKIIAPTCQR
jgi:hypothetical protein